MLDKMTPEGGLSGMQFLRSYSAFLWLIQPNALAALAFKHVKDVPTVRINDDSYESKSLSAEATHLG